MKNKVLIFSLLFLIIGAIIGWYAALGNNGVGPLANLHALRVSANVYPPNMSCAQLWSAAQAELAGANGSGTRRQRNQHLENYTWLMIRYYRAGCGNY